MKHIDDTIKTLRQLNEYQTAWDLLKTLARNSDTIEQLDFVARLQNESKDYHSSIENIKRMMDLTESEETKYSLRANLAKMYNHINEPHLSIEQSELNRAVNPNNYDTIMEIGFSYYLAGEHEKSVGIMNNLIYSKDTPEEIRGRCLYNKGHWDLEEGRFKQGLRGHVEHGRRIGILPPEQYPLMLKWDGEIDQNKTLLILSEGGIGDEFIYVRFVSFIEKLGMKCVWVSANKQIKEVFCRNGIRCILRSEIQDLSDEDIIQVQAFNLPVMLDLEVNQVYTGPYLTACPEYINKWHHVAGGYGFKWYGNNLYDQDLHRSIPFELIENITVDGYKYSLQLEGCPESRTMMDCSDGINNIEDTLAILSLVNCTVSSCTSVVHMAGSIGARVIVAPPIASYHVWSGRNDEKSNWYGDNVTVVRQKSWRDWDTVINRIQEILNGNQ